MSFQARATAGVRWITLSTICNAATDTARTIVLARFLSPEEYGLMAMSAIAIGLAQMYIDLGVSAAIIHRQNTTKQQLSSLYWLNIFVGIVVFGLVYLGAPWVQLFFREPRIVPLLRALSVVFLIVPIGSQFDILLQKELMFNVLARWEIVASFSSTVVAILCAVTGCGAWALVFSFLTNASVKTALLVRIGFSRFPPLFHFRCEDLDGYLGFGLFQMGERSINYLAERLDQMLIGPLLGAHALGLYNFALYLTAQPLSRINPILTRVAFPLFSKFQHDSAKLRRGYLRLVSLIATVNAPLLVGLAAVAPWAVPEIFGAKWIASVPLVQILSFVSLSRCMGNPIGTLQLAKGRADLGFWWNLLLLACSIPIIYLGGNVGGVIGVAAALLILHVCINVPSYLLLVRPLIGNCAQAYVGATLKPVTLAGIMGLVVSMLPVMYGGAPAKTALAFQIMLGAVIYVMLVCILDRRVIADFRSTLLPNAAPRMAEQDS